jgi:hypothetical protein
MPLEGIKMEAKLTIQDLQKKAAMPSMRQQPIKDKPLSIKVRLAMLGKKQVDLFEELNKIGGEYRVSAPSNLNNIINERRTGGKAQMILMKCNQILNKWEMENHD